MVKTKEILQFLEETFQTSEVADPSYNGLQFEGSNTVTRIVTGVDATISFCRAAVKAKGDFAFVHHGIFWKNAEWRKIDRFNREIVKTMTEGNLNLYGLHLPLDSHPEFGNNACIATALGLRIQKPFGVFINQKIGWLATLDKPISVSSFKKRIQKVIGPLRAHLDYGPEQISIVGIVSGGGWDSITSPEVYDGQVDAIITGEVAHQGAALTKDRNIHMFAAGHYATEVFGVKAVGELLSREFKLPWVFIDQPSGL